eukprot:9977566-Prorocentrum_lima.AAC.1
MGSNITITTVRGGGILGRNLPRQRCQPPGIISRSLPQTFNERVVKGCTDVRQQDVARHQCYVSDQSSCCIQSC